MNFNFEWIRCLPVYGCCLHCGKHNQLTIYYKQVIVCLDCFGKFFDLISAGLYNALREVK